MRLPHPRPLATRPLATRPLATLLVAVLLAFLLSGCELGQDDEMVQPTRTLTASPSATVTVLPKTVPVGRGVVAAGDVVWAHQGTLHVGPRSVDLSPVVIDGFVSVPGGVYLVHDAELWFTDMTKLRGTGITGVTGLGVNADGSRIVVSVASPDGEGEHAFDTSSGQVVSPEGVVPVTAADRLRGPSRGGVKVPAGFELAGWAGTGTFYGTASTAGTAGTSGARESVVSCDRGTRTCTRLGTVETTSPVLFGTGVTG